MVSIYPYVGRDQNLEQFKISSICDIQPVPFVLAASALFKSRGNGMGDGWATGSRLSWPITIHHFSSVTDPSMGLVVPSCFTMLLDSRRMDFQILRFVRRID